MEMSVISTAPRNFIFSSDSMICINIIFNKSEVYGLILRSQGGFLASLKGYFSWIRLGAMVGHILPVSFRLHLVQVARTRMLRSL